MQLVWYAVLPIATALVAGLVSTLSLAFGWQTGISALGSVAVFPLLFLLVYQVTLRPRLFVYNTLIIHWAVWPTLAVIIGLFWWIFIVADGHSAINPVADIMLIVGGMLFSWIVVAWRFPLLWKALTPARAPEEQVQMQISYLGKASDKVGRASPYPDGYVDAAFSLDILKGSPHLQKTVTQILLNRVDIRGMPRQQQWIANDARVLWPLAVFDTSGRPLNPVGASCAIILEDKLSLILYASDWAEAGSDWFTAGQRYRVTVYFSDNTWTEGQTIIN